MTSPGQKSPPAHEPGPRTGRHLRGEQPTFDEGRWVGRTIDDRYRIDALLGEGGMGAVFIAQHLKLDKKVALKVILPQFAGDGEIAERFAREAMASAKLDHPHVASALDYGTLPEGGAYLVMQYVRGRSLRSLMRDKAGEPRFACEIGAQIADALAAAHAAGIVHRDLKPDNVVLETKDDGGELLRVLDFGIARVVGEGGAQEPTKRQLTRVGTIIGTPGYMAPEQALGETVDARADIYALGVVLWELLAGETLFTDEDLTALVTKQLTTMPAPLPAAVPEPLRALVARMLSRDRNDRPERASEVRDQLKRFLLTSEVERLSASSASIAIPTVTGPHPTAAPGVPLPLVGLLMFMVLGLAAMVLTGVIALMQPPSAPVAAPTPAPAVVDPVALPVGAEPPEEPPVAEPAEPPPRGPLGRDFDVLMASDDADERHGAAERITSAGDSIAPVARLSAEAELAERCTGRREAIVSLRELGDARALPLLERFDELPRRGCGFLRTQDCWRCMRRDLSRALRELRGEPAP